MDQAKVEYELQHFNFCSEDIIAESSFCVSTDFLVPYRMAFAFPDQLLVKSLIQQTLISFTDEFIAKHKMSAEEAMEMRSHCYPAASEMFAECGPKLEELSELYRRTFNIPDNILLPSDLMHRKGYTADQVESLQSVANGLERQIRQDGVFLSMLEEEIKLHERLDSCVESGEQLMELAERYRQMEIVPAEDCAVVQDLADFMKNVMQMWVPTIILDMCMCKIFCALDKNAWMLSNFLIGSIDSSL